MKMPVYRSENGTFYSQFFYRDGRGAKRHKVKRGFATELEALMWEKDFLAVHNGTMDMLFTDFVDVYATEIRPRIREHTCLTKEYMIKDKIIPFFGKMRMSEIKPIDVVRWQNQLIDHKDANGKPYSATYLRTINNQLNAIFNHAERYYDLTGNPCRKVTKMGSKKGGEMNFWTKKEYLRFSEAIMDKPLSFMLLRSSTGQVSAVESSSPSPHPISSSRLRSSASRSRNTVLGITRPRIAAEMPSASMDTTRGSSKVSWVFTRTLPPSFSSASQPSPNKVLSR